MITAEQVIRLLLELDQQVINPRPSLFGEAAELVKLLCEHAEGSLRGDHLGIYESVDIRQIYHAAPERLSQPIIDEICKTLES